MPKQGTKNFDFTRMEGWGLSIARFIYANKIKLIDVGKAIGVDPSTISGWFYGRKPFFRHKKAMNKFIEEYKVNSKTFVDEAGNDSKEQGLYAISSTIGTREEVNEIIAKWMKDGVFKNGTKVIKVEKVFTPKASVEWEAE